MTFILALALLFILLKVGGKSVKKILTCLGTRWRDLPKYFAAGLVILGLGVLCSAMDVTAMYISLNNGAKYVPSVSWSGIVWYVVEFLLLCDFVGTWLVILKHVCIDKNKDVTDDFIIDSSKQKSDEKVSKEQQ